LLPNDSAHPHQGQSLDVYLKPHRSFDGSVSNKHFRKIPTQCKQSFKQPLCHFLPLYKPDCSSLGRISEWIPSLLARDCEFAQDIAHCIKITPFVCFGEIVQIVRPQQSYPLMQTLNRLPHQKAKIISRAVIIAWIRKNET
jgi:hypothetical protein